MASANKKGRLKPNGSDGLSINPSNNKCHIKQNPLRLQGIFIFGCGSRIRTYDLRVMSPTSYHAAPSRVRSCNYTERRNRCQAFLTENAKNAALQKTVRMV